MNKGIDIYDIKRYALEHNIKKIVAGISGGSDSCCLLHVLKESGIEVIALHCNFNLRGEESLRDQKFVEELCKSLNIKLCIISFDTDEYIRTHKGNSVEMACRNLRHKWFIERMNEFNADRIVLGHNADDNIETFFLNLLRGSGTKGLKGMLKDNLTIWRPLLNYHKNEILEYLKSKKAEYVTDSSNLTDDYRRNLLRNKIIPLFKSEWKGFDTALDKTIKHLNDENNVVEGSLEQILIANKNKLPVETIKNYKAPELLIRRFLSELHPYSKTPEEIMASIQSEKPHTPEWHLPGGVVKIIKGNLTIM